MTAQSGRNKLDWGTAIFAVIVLAAYLSMAAGTTQAFSTAELVVLIGLGVVYALTGTYGWLRAERAGTQKAFAAYFAIQIPLGALILYLSRTSGFMSLLFLPLAGHSAVHLPSRGTALVSGLIVLAFILALAPVAGWSFAVSIGLTSFLAGVVFAVVFTRITVRAEQSRRETERLAAELREANQKLSAYAAQVEELATTTERNRLARDIHDSLGHYLTVINMQLEAARAVFDADPTRAIDAVRKAQALAQEGLAEVRHSVYALRAGPSGDRPLPELIASLVEECRAAGTQAELVVLGTPRPLGPQAEHALYRAVQEALTNVRKHAWASRVNIRLDYGDEERVRLAVQDDGVGSARSDGGFGLLGLRERIGLLGGLVQTASRPGQGFELDVEVPA
ncbi:MAG TPA: sensor histidine kinase [Herpetosiphonaceae bacterium]|nr:sensor histidine kinase [Herpetosiphonaceae bacterium]